MCGVDDRTYDFGLKTHFGDAKIFAGRLATAVFEEAHSTITYVDEGELNSVRMATPDVHDLLQKLAVRRDRQQEGHLGVDAGTW